MLAPAACYPIYPIAAERGAVPAAGLSSTWPATASAMSRRAIDRFQSLPHARICPHRHAASRSRIPRALDQDRAKGIADTLGLPYTVDVANDPFFGRGGTIMASSSAAVR